MNASSSHHPILDITRIASNLKQAVIGHTIDYHGTVSSTMAIAHQLAADPATRSGTLIASVAQEGLIRLRTKPNK